MASDASSWMFAVRRRWQSTLLMFKTICAFIATSAFTRSANFFPGNTATSVLPTEVTVAERNGKAVEVELKIAMHCTIRGNILQ